MITKKNNRVVLSIGANLGDKNSSFIRVLIDIRLKLGELIQISSIYKSKPWGFESSDDFYNQIVIIDTTLQPNELLTAIWEIERSFGREKLSVNKEVEKYRERLMAKKVSYQSRFMDIDIIYYNSEIINTPLLRIPHPHVNKRMFVLSPLSEVLPNFINPQLGKTTLEMIEDFNNES